MDIQELLAKAFDIGNKTKFNIRIYENDVLYVESKMSYTELGMYLVANPDKIKRIDIRLI